MKIRFKLILAVAGVSLAILGVFCWFADHAQHRALLAQVEHNAHQLSETIKSGTRADMLLNLRERVHATIDTIGAQEGIETVRIFNKEGAIIYSSERAAVGALVDQRAEACYACHTADQPLEQLPIDERTRVFSTEDRARRLAIINPIYNEPACWQAACHAHVPDQKVLGVLDVTMSLAEVDRQLASSRRAMLWLGLTALVAISAIIWVSHEVLVVQPVERLVAATDAVAAGNLQTQLAVHRHDELGRLAQRFNAMTRQLAEVQQQLFQSEKLASIGRLAAGVAHEINNPLTGVLTYSSFLAKRLRDDPAVYEDLETIVRETKRCRQIVKGLLDFSRQVPARLADVALGEIVDKSLEIVRNRLAEDDIRVVRHVPPDLPPLRADVNQMLQVLINLLLNAADAIAKQGGGGEIRIRAEREEPGALRVEIADDGCGIPQDELGKIFEPFYTTKPQGQGTGLGLAVVWGIVDKHGGRIAITSEPGVGTTVTLHLPTGAAVPRPPLLEEVAG